MMVLDHYFLREEEGEELGRGGEGVGRAKVEGVGEGSRRGWGRKGGSQGVGRVEEDRRRG